MSSLDNLGPLPHADGGAELQRTSLAAFRAALSDAEWIVRDERVEDLGVDVSLEVVAGGRGTNLRSQVQLKARSDLEPNADGSWSVSVPVSNLNYLLNGPTPFYVLFRPETRDLYMASARDEVRRIEASTPAWKDQGHITLRFSDRLDPAGVARIRERIIHEACANRRLHDEAMSLAPGSRIPVDAATLEPQSPREAERLLLETGMVAVTYGYGNKILDICGIVPLARFAEEPKLLLVRGYAEFFAGRYLRADAPLREALISAGKLSTEDRHFLRFLISAIDLAQGNISNEAFRTRSETWRADAPPVLAAEYDLLHHWLVRVEAKSEEAQAASESALRSTIDRLVALPGVPQSVVHYAEALRLFLDAQTRAMRLVDVLALGPELWPYRHSEPRDVVVAREFAAIASWEARASALTIAVTSAGNIPRFCEIRYTCDLSDTMILSYRQLAATITGSTSPDVPDALVERVRLSRRFASDQGQVEFELRGGLVESDLEDLRGNEKAARAIAQDVHDRAQALRFADIERIAGATLRDGGIQAARRREIEAARANDGDGLFLTMTEEMLESMAEFACETLGLPTDRLPIIRDGLRCEVAGAVERQTWCRHLRSLERAPPGASRFSTSAPERCWTCEHFHHRSLITGTDWGGLLKAFRRTYCDGCSARAPRDVNAFRAPSC